MKFWGVLSGITIRGKILFLTFGGIAIFVSLSIGANVIGKSEIHHLEQMYVKNLTNLDSLKKIQLIFREVEFRMAASSAGMIPAGESIVHLGQAIKNIDKLWRRAQSSVHSEEFFREHEKFATAYKNFKKMRGPLEEAYRKISDDNDTGPMEAAYREWRTYRVSIFKSIDTMVEIQSELLRKRYLERVTLINRVRILSTAGNGIMTLIFIILTFLIFKSISRPIDTVIKMAKEVAGGDFTCTVDLDTKDEMGVMASEMNTMIDKLNSAFRIITDEVESLFQHAEGLSGVSDLLVAGAEAERMQVNNVAASAEQMSNAITEVGKNTSEAELMTEGSYETARKGSDIVGETKLSIAELSESVAGASEAIGNLGESSNRVGEIVSVIKDIADQTNLLALNAAIESARAGEQGRGFAVVADEVRKLSERTTQATGEVTDIIQAIQAETKSVISSLEKGKLITESAIARAEQTGESHDSIVKSCRNVLEMVQSIASSTEEQSVASKQVSESMSNIVGVINQTVMLSENIKSVSQELTAVASQLRNQIDGFKTRPNETEPLKAVRIETSVAHETAAR
jgi:methyl-accepting chemotaxis protein